MAGFLHPYLRHHVTINTVAALPFFVRHEFGSKRGVGRVLGLSYQYFSEAVVVLQLVSALCAVPAVWHDMNILCGCISSTSHSMQLVAKTVHLKLSRRRFLDHLAAFHRVLEENASLHVAGLHRLDFRTFHHLSSSYVRKYMTIHLAGMMTVTALYFTPFLVSAFARPDTISQQHTPIVSYLPFDLLVPLNFQLTCVFQAVAFFFYNIKLIAIDYFVLAMITLHAAQYRYLNETLQKLVADPTQTKSLRNWVKLHQQSMEETVALKSLLGQYLFIEFAYILIHTCVPAFVITSTLSWSITQKITLLVISGGGLFQLFILASAGDALVQITEESSTHLYGAHLFRGGLSCFQDAIKMVTPRLLALPQRLGYRTLFPLGRAIFGTILRLIISYYMTLNELQSLKD